MKKNKVAVTVATSIMLLSSGCFALANPTTVSADSPQASFDISKYGAKANDSSFDNAPIINKLIDQLPKDGGVIEIPAGTYYLKTPIKVDKSFITIKGVNDGWRSGVDPANSNGVESGGSHLELVNKNTDAIDVKSADSHRLSGDEFRDINIEGQSSTGIGINVQSDNDHIVINGTSMKNLGTDIVNKGADCTRITNNQLAESRNNIDLTGASQQAEIEHNQLGAQPGGISVQLENPSNYAINSNLIYPDGSSDITLYNPSHGTVWGNTLSSYTTGLINVLPNSQGAKGNANVIASNQLTINQFNKNGYVTNTLHNDLGWGAIHDENYRDLINHNNLELNAPKGTAGIVMNSSLGSRAQDNIVTVNNLAAVDNKVPQPAAPTVSDNASQGTNQSTNNTGSSNGSTAGNTAASSSSNKENTGTTNNGSNASGSTVNNTSTNGSSNKTGSSNTENGSSNGSTNNVPANNGSSSPVTTTPSGSAVNNTPVNGSSNKTGSSNTGNGSSSGSINNVPANNGSSSSNSPVTTTPSGSAVNNTPVNGGSNKTSSSNTGNSSSNESATNSVPVNSGSSSSSSPVTTTPSGSAVNNTPVNGSSNKTNSSNTENNSSSGSTTNSVPVNSGSSSSNGTTSSGSTTEGNMIPSNSSEGLLNGGGTTATTDHVDASNNESTSNTGNSIPTNSSTALSNNSETTGNAQTNSQAMSDNSDDVGNMIPNNPLGNQVIQDGGTTATTDSVKANQGVVDLESSSAKSQSETSKHIESSVKRTNEVSSSVKSSSITRSRKSSLTPAEKNRSQLMSQVIAGNEHKDDDAVSSSSVHSSSVRSTVKTSQRSSSKVSSAQSSSMISSPDNSNGATANGQGNNQTNGEPTFAQTGGTGKVSHNWLYNLIYKIFK